MLIDSHFHLDLIAEGQDEQKAVLETCRNKNIRHLIHISTDEQSFFTIAPLAKLYPGLVSLTLGFPPASAEHINLHKIKQMLEKKQICAIGEIGLDYYHSYGTPALQRKLFCAQLDLAAAMGLPVVIHTREADQDTLAVLRDYRGIRGVIHCYSSPPDFGAAVVELGLSVSFAGNLTYKNARDLHEAAAVLPLDRMLIETDAPFLSPVPLRGTKNVPWNIEHTARFLAELKGVSYEHVCRQTADNAAALFSL